MIRCNDFIFPVIFECMDQNTIGLHLNVFYVVNASVSDKFFPLFFPINIAYGLNPENKFSRFFICFEMYRSGPMIGLMSFPSIEEIGQTEL